MSTDLAVRPTASTELTIDANQQAFNSKQVAALRQLGVKDASPADLAVFFHYAVRTGLDPFARQVYMIGRWSKDGIKQTIQTGIDGYRLIARRASDRFGVDLSYDDTMWCGADGQWTDVWLSENPPAAAKVTIYRGDARYSAVALWREYVQTNKDGTPNAMWSRMSSNQLAKVAEAAVLRKAFPQDLSGLHIDEEMPDVIDAVPEPEPPQAVTKVRRAVVAKPPKPEPREPDLEPPGKPPAAAHDSVDGYVDVELPLPELGVPQSEPITDQQRKLMQQLFREADIPERENRLAFVHALGFNVTSSNDLTKHEASRVIAALQAELDSGTDEPPEDET